MADPEHEPAMSAHPDTAPDRRRPGTVPPLSQKLPQDGVKIPLRVSFIGLRRVPILALGHNNAAPLLVLFEDHLVQRVIFKHERKYSEIESVDVSRTDTDNLEI